MRGCLGITNTCELEATLPFTRVIAIHVLTYLAVPYLKH